MSRFPASHDTYVCALAKTYPQLIVSTLQHVLDQLWYTPTFLYHRFVIAIAHAEESHQMTQNSSDTKQVTEERASGL